MGRRPKGYEKDIIPVKQCTATSKHSGKRCKNKCVLGYDVCHYHGARGGRPLIHGVYSKKLVKTFFEAHNEYVAEMNAISILTSDTRAEMWKMVENEDLSADKARNIVSRHTKKTKSYLMNKKRSNIL